MSTSGIFHDIESSLGGSCSISVDVPMVQVNEHVFEHSFFRTYIPGAQLNVDAHIGGYPASIFGTWKPTETNGCNMCGYGAPPGTPKPPNSNKKCLHPFTLHPAAREIACLLKCRGLPDTAFWRVAEVEWKKRTKAIQKKVDENKAKVTNAIIEIYQLVGLAFAFQGLVITTAITTVVPQQLHTCPRTVWWYIILSIFATVVTIVGGKFKVALVKKLRKGLNNDKPLLSEHKRLLKKLTMTEGPGFNLIPKSIDIKPRLRILKTFLQKRIYPIFEHSTFILICLGVFGCICMVIIVNLCEY